MSAAADAPGVDDGTINLDALRLIRQRKRYFRELQGDPITKAAPPPFVGNLEMRQGLDKARPRFCVSSLGVYYYVPAEFGTVRGSFMP